MVRVNHPPGGHTKLDTQTSRNPQTVRILQPPGGESSISFSDDNQARNGSRFRRENASSDRPSVNTQEPKFESKRREGFPSQEESKSREGHHLHEESKRREGHHSQEESKRREGNPSQEEYKRREGRPSQEDSSDHNGLKGKIYEEETSDLSNGAESPTSNEPEKPAESLKSENGSEFPLPKELECKYAETATSESKVEKESEISECQESYSEKQNEVTVSEVSVTEASVSSRSEIRESSNVEVSSVSENLTEEASSESVKISKESNEIIESEDLSTSEKEETNDRNHNLPPLHIQRNDSLSATASTPSPTVSSAGIGPGEGTGNRVIGQSTVNPLPQQPAPRKIKDHMRSNIFMSDEDYMPMRTSRTNATINDKKQDMPAAGQRQRIPPGGFSTKLW